MDFHSSSLNNGKAAIIQEDLASFWCNVDSGKEDVGQKAAKVKGSENPMMMGSASKRHRGSNQNSQVSRCQVEGCNLDLSGAKDYHRRHRICECHSKSPKVIVAGLERRFCQQCSRFHSLVEFDEKKRSCRRRLSDHNARRRRQHPETAHLRTAGLTSSLYERRPSSFLVNRLASSLATTTNWESSCSSKMTMAESTLMRSSGHGSSSPSANSYMNEAQHFPVALSLLSSSSDSWELNQHKSSSLHNPIFMHHNGSIGQPAIALDSQNWPLYSPQHVSAEQAHSRSPL